MRSVIVVLVFATAIIAANAANAERRLFVIANNADGYGVDRCLARGETCGAVVATAYCRSREFAQAVSYRKVEKDDMTGAIPASTDAGCYGSVCDEYVAIECAR